MTARPFNSVGLRYGYVGISSGPRGGLPPFRLMILSVGTRSPVLEQLPQSVKPVVAPEAAYHLHGIRRIWIAFTNPEERLHRFDPVALHDVIVYIARGR